MWARLTEQAAGDILAKKVTALIEEQDDSLDVLADLVLLESVVATVEIICYFVSYGRRLSCAYTSFFMPSRFTF